MTRRRRPTLGVTPSSEEEPEPYSATEVRRRVDSHLETERFLLSRHARQRMTENDMDLLDVLNVLRAGRVREDLTAFEAGTYRYRVETPRMAVVVAFNSRREQMVVVTAFRLGSGL